MNRRGFTIIELLIVIAVITLLGAIGYSQYSKVMAKAKAAQLESQLKQIQTGLAKYYKDLGTFPYYLDYLIKKPVVSDDTTQVGKGGWDSFSAAIGQPDDPTLVDYWGGPYVDGMKESPDVQHCLLSTLGGPICFGAKLTIVNGVEEFTKQGQRIDYPFADNGDGGAATIDGKSHGSEPTSDNYYNVLQIAEVPKDIATYVFKDMNGRNPLTNGNLLECAYGDADDTNNNTTDTTTTAIKGDPTMFIGMPALKDYSKSNRIIYRYFRLY